MFLRWITPKVLPKMFFDTKNDLKGFFWSPQHHFDILMGNMSPKDATVTSLKFKIYYLHYLFVTTTVLMASNEYSVSSGTVQIPNMFYSRSADLGFFLLKVEIISFQRILESRGSFFIIFENLIVHCSHKVIMMVFQFYKVFTQLIYLLCHYLHILCMDGIIAAVTLASYNFLKTPVCM